MSDFITDAEWQFEKYCEIAEEYGFVDLNAKKSGFRCTTKTAEFNAGWISFTGGVAAVRDEQQAIIDDLKTQLNNMEQCYIQIKKINDEQSEIIQGHFAARQEMQKRVDMALTWLTRTDIRAINMAREILQGGDLKNLRGEHEPS